MIWIVSIAAAASTGWALYLYAVNRTLDRNVCELARAHRTMLERFNRTGELYSEACDALHALRRNCFITNERGHRVKYRNASPEARAKAEGIVK
jgi:hypothetical protein